MDYMELSDNLNEQLSKARGERDIAIKHMVDLEYQVCRLREELQKNEASLSEIFSRTYGPFKQKISQWLQAEQDGRLVVLPSKTVWELTMDAGPDCDLKCPVDAYDEALGCDLCSKAKPFAYERPCTQERLKGLGKTVFLTREEAEAALKGGEG